MWVMTIFEEEDSGEEPLSISIQPIRFGCVVHHASKLFNALAAFLVFLHLSSLPTAAAETWPEVLARMPLNAAIPQLNRSNCVDTMLHAFQSNRVVKALIFMPAATDEFYLFRRAKADLTNASPTLLDAVIALTNQTFIRATFRPPLLLLHTDEDPLEPDVTV